MGLGRYSHYGYTIDTEINQYVLIRSSCCTDTSGSIISHLTFLQLSKRLKHIEFDFNYVQLNTLWIKLWYTLLKWSFCFSTSICWLHCIDQPKAFTLLLKSKILDFETLNHVHVYHIEYVSYQHGPYRICIISAADGIDPVLINNNECTVLPRLKAPDLFLLQM